MWIDELNDLALLPRAQQYSALQQLRKNFTESHDEQWNTAFGPTSLYEAWTQLPLMQGLYQRNRAVIQETLQGRSDWHIVEIGGGNGALWRGLLDTQQAGTLTLIDPHAEAHDAVAARLPGNVTFRPIVASAEHVEIPDADVIVCSLTLHHVAGLDSAQRRSFGLEGDGKAEILRRCVAAIQGRDGTGLLNEADCYNELDLPPGDPVLVDHFLDVYVRRTARAIAHASEHAGVDAQRRQAWEAILRHWCLDQVDNAFLPREQRDVYELDAVHWIDLLQQAGAQHVTHRYTDEWNLFQQYAFR